MLCKYLEGNNFFNCKSCIELGSGTGFCGLVSSLFGKNEAFTNSWLYFDYRSRRANETYRGQCSFIYLTWLNEQTRGNYLGTMPNPVHLFIPGRMNLPGMHRLWNMQQDHFLGFQKDEKRTPSELLNQRWKQHRTQEKKEKRVDIHTHISEKHILTLTKRDAGLRIWSSSLPRYRQLDLSTCPFPIRPS